MKIRVWIWGLLLLVGVGHIVPYKSIDPEFEPYIYKLELLSIDKCKSFKLPNQFIVKLEDMSDRGYLGLCKVNPFRAEITIDKNHWTYGSDDDKIALVTHEFAHCTLGLDHVPDPNHYMYESYVPLLGTDVIRQYLKDVERTCE